jgi:A nuclease family of the HNH/ENDO VII superfamily with conserved AHH
MTIQSWANAGLGITPKLDSLLAGGAINDSALMAMRAPRDVPTPLWNLSSTSERRAMIESLPMMAASAVALPVGGQAAIDIGALMRAATSGIGPYAGIFLRASVLSLPLMLSGDTPQPAQQDIKFGDLTLRLTAPRAGAEIGAAGTRAEFRVDKPGWIHFGEGSRRLDVPVSVSNGQLRFNTGALEGAYGRPLPDAISAMAARPTGVPGALQTTPAGIKSAMAGAPDPCRNLPGERHHIIPAEIMGSHSAFLTRVGFKLDQSANMIKLPRDGQQRSDMQSLCQETRPVHSGRHPADYGRAIGERLREIESRNLSAADSRVAINRLMSEIRQVMVSGNYAKVNDPNLVQFIRSLKL